MSEGVPTSIFLRKKSKYFEKFSGVQKSDFFRGDPSKETPKKSKKPHSSSYYSFCLAKKIEVNTSEIDVGTTFKADPPTLTWKNRK